MTYRVVIESRAARALKKLQDGIRGRISNAINELRDNPRPTGSQKLTGSHDTYRIRVGDYRVVYEIVDRELIVYIIDLGHRREIYRQ